MSNNLDESISPADAFASAFEFKGKELLPFSEGRRSAAMAAGVRLSGNPAPGPNDMHAIIFICQSDKLTLAKAQRDPDGFWVKVLDWADANISPEDYEVEGELVRKLLEAAYATKAEPITEEGAGADLGN